MKLKLHTKESPFGKIETRMDLHVYQEVSEQNKDTKWQKISIKRDEKEV